MFSQTTFVLRVDLSVSISFLWLVLPVTSRRQVLLLYGHFSPLHFDKWWQHESFLLLLDGRVGLCCTCIFCGVLVPLIQLVVNFFVDSFCLFLAVSLVPHSCFHVFCLSFPFFRAAVYDSISLSSLLSLQSNLCITTTWRKKFL